jgi:hypothetical protein
MRLWSGVGQLENRSTWQAYIALFKPMDAIQASQPGRSRLNIVGGFRGQHPELGRDAWILGDEVAVTQRQGKWSVEKVVGCPSCQLRTRQSCLVEVSGVHRRHTLVCRG